MTYFNILDKKKNIKGTDRQTDRRTKNTCRLKSPGGLDRDFFFCHFLLQAVVVFFFFPLILRSQRTGSKIRHDQKNLQQKGHNELSYPEYERIYKKNKFKTRYVDLQDIS